MDDHPEVLDVAAVEAALSLCENIEDAQSLAGPWEHSIEQEHPIQQEHEKQDQLPQMAVTVKQERPDCEEAEPKEIRDLMSIGDQGTEIKTEPAEQEQIHLGAEEAAALLTRTNEAPKLRGQVTEGEGPGIAGVERSDMEIDSTKDEVDHNRVKTEVCEQGGFSGIMCGWESST